MSRLVEWGVNSPVNPISTTTISPLSSTTVSSSSTVIYPFSCSVYVGSSFQCSPLQIEKILSLPATPTTSLYSLTQTPQGKLKCHEWFQNQQLNQQQFIQQAQALANWKTPQAQQLFNMLGKQNRKQRKSNFILKSSLICFVCFVFSLFPLTLLLSFSCCFFPV